MSSRSRELIFSFLNCTLKVRFGTQFHDIGRITLDDVEIGRIEGLHYDPSVKVYRTWKVFPQPQLPHTNAVYGTLNVCLSLCVGNWLMSNKQNFQPINQEKEEFSYGRE